MFLDTSYGLLNYLILHHNFCVIPSSVFSPIEVIILPSSLSLDATLFAFWINL